MDISDSDVLGYACALLYVLKMYILMKLEY